MSRLGTRPRERACNNRWCPSGSARKGRVVSLGKAVVLEVGPDLDFRVPVLGHSGSFVGNCFLPKAGALVLPATSLSNVEKEV